MSLPLIPSHHARSHPRPNALHLYSSHLQLRKILRGAAEHTLLAAAVGNAIAVDRGRSTLDDPPLPPDHRQTRFSHPLSTADTPQIDLAAESDPRRQRERERKLSSPRRANDSNVNDQSRWREPRIVNRETPRMPMLSLTMNAGSVPKVS